MTLFYTKCDYCGSPLSRLYPSCCLSCFDAIIIPQQKKKAKEQKKK